MTTQEILSIIREKAGLKEKEFEVVEKMANIEHARWAKWQKYMHSHVYDSSESINPHLKVIPTELYNRWEKQIATQYSELSEKEKDSDRDQVKPYLEIIGLPVQLQSCIKCIPKERWLELCEMWVGDKDLSQQEQKVIDFVGKNIL